MKKNLIVICTAVLLLCVSFPAHSEKQSYSFGVFWDQGSKMNVSFSTMAKDFTKALSMSGDMNFMNLFYSELDKFHDDIMKRKVDFIYANTEDDLLLAIMYGYDPIATISIFGKEKASHCLYVQKDSDIQRIGDLSGKKIITYPHLVAYTLLRKLIEAPPEDTFSHMSTSTNAYASVDALAAGEVDAIFLIETNIDFFEQVNPAPVKKIRQLACAEPYHFMPLMVSPEVPETVQSQLENFYIYLRQNKNLQKYQPFMKQVDLKIIPVTYKNYEPFFNLYEFGLEKNWDKDFENWIAAMNE